MRSTLISAVLGITLWPCSLRAADGLDVWTVRANPLNPTNWLYGVAFGNDQFVAVGGAAPPSIFGTSVVIASPNGTDWVPGTVPAQSGSLVSVTSGDGVYVAAGRTILSSPDARSWSTAFSGSYGFTVVGYGRSMFLAGTSGTAYLSTNQAKGWGLSYLPFETSFIQLAFGHGEYLAVGGHGGLGGVLTSADGTNWSSQLYDPAIRSVSFGGGTYVAVAANGAIKTSTDGTTWIARESGTTNQLLGLAFGGGTFVAVGNMGTILTSRDAATWATRITAVTNDLRAVTYGNGRFVAVGANATILESDPIMFFDAIQGASLGAVQFNVGGTAGQRCKLQTSVDLTSWTALADITIGSPATALVVLAPTNNSLRVYRMVIP